MVERHRVCQVEGGTRPIAIIDRTSLIRPDNPATRDDWETDAVRRAATEQSTFYLRGHGAEELASQLLRAHQDFFALPREEKLRVAARTAQGPGYHLRGPDHQMFVALRGATSPVDANLWPARPPGLAELATRYLDGMYALAMPALGAIARSLGLPGGFFEPYFGPSSLQSLQLHHYDGALAPSSHEFLSPHVDPTALTLIVQDDVGGLESLIARDWVPVPAVPGALVLQLGELLARWTNDRYTASTHRVSNPAASVRRSIVYSLVPRLDAVLECLPGCADELHPARYAPTLVADYLRDWARANTARIEPFGDQLAAVPDPAGSPSTIPDELRKRVAAATNGRWAIRSVTRRGDVLDMEFDVLDRPFSLHAQDSSAAGSCYKRLGSVAFWYRGRLEPPVDLSSIDQIIQAVAPYAVRNLADGP